MARGYIGDTVGESLHQGNERGSPGRESAPPYVGGYGLGAKIIFDRMPGTDPLGPDAISGFSPVLSTAPRPWGVPVCGRRKIAAHRGMG